MFIIGIVREMQIDDANFKHIILQLQVHVYLLTYII